MIAGLLIEKSVRAFMPLFGTLMLFAMHSSRAAEFPPLPDQKEWDEAIAKFSQDPDSKLAANRRLVMEAELGFAQALRYGHTREIFERYVSPNYVQHDPNMAPGREGLISSFESAAAQFKSMQGEQPQGGSAIPKLVMAQGDYVALVFQSERADPADKSKTYVYYPVAVFRIENGKLAEHWGGEPKGAR